MLQIAQYAELEVILALLCAVSGLFGLALYPVCLELSVECSFPVGEGTAAGFLVLSGFVMSLYTSVVFTHFMTFY